MKHIVLAAALLGLSACASHQPTKNALMSTPGFMNQAQTIERQRPTLPITHYIRWHSQDRLTQGLELDYISGMSQRDYLFVAPNQELFRPMVGAALSNAGLQARTAVGARYALQIDFHDLDTAAFGYHFAGKSSATYRIVDRHTNSTVYENLVRSNFITEIPGLNERDLSFAYDVSSTGVGAATAAFSAFSIYEAGLVEVWNHNEKLQDFFGRGTISEISQSDWNNVYQAYAWVAGVSAVAGPALVLLDQVNPANYVAMQVTPRGETPIAAQGARRGALSTSGVGSRNARTRAEQLNSHILAQSLTYFLLDLAQQENVTLTQLVACKDGDQAAEDLIRAVRAGAQLVSDDCMQYVKKDQRRGVPITAYR